MSERELHRRPVVTIFGAGVAGLTAAHELIERGFDVQVVEAAEDPDDEYGCQVGGLAANQLARIPADPRRLHPYLYDEDPRAEDTEDPYLNPLLRYVLVEVKQAGACTIKLDIDGHARNVPATAAQTPNTIAQNIATQANSIPGITVTVGGPQLKITATDSARAPQVRIHLEPTTTSLRLVYEDLALLSELRATHMLPVEPRFALCERLQFERGATKADWKALRDSRGTLNSVKLPKLWERIRAAYASHSDGLKQRLANTETDVALLSPRVKDREELVVEIRGHTDDEGTTAANDRILTLAWAQWVKEEIVALDQALPLPDRIPNLEQRLIAIGVGTHEPIGNPRRAGGRRCDNRVELRIVENVIPGEHGYRFFPRFYRHLFDTMKRTPLLDALGHETGDTAFDQLEASEVVDLAVNIEREVKPAAAVSANYLALAPKRQKTPVPIPVRRPRSLEELRKLLRLNLAEAAERGLGLEPRDLLRFQLSVLKFLTSSRRRREDYEKTSWMEFLGGEDPAKAYTRRMYEILKETPQALLAMRADETDARSQGVIYSQLLMDALGDGSEANRTLNGPTTVAWLRHWKRYLKRQGVRFFCGRLDELNWQTAGAELELVPVVTRRFGEGNDVSIWIRAPGPAEIAIDGVSVSASGADVATLLQSFVTAVNATAPGLHLAVTKQLIEPASTTGVLFGVLRLQATAMTPQGSFSVAARSRNVAVLGARPDELGERFVSQPLTEKSEFLLREADFYVLAVPYPEASRLVSQAFNGIPAGGTFDGCFEELRRFDRTVEFTDLSGNRLDSKRNAYGRPHAKYPLRDLSGVQFYSEHQVRVGHGHTYFPDAPWGLSSISQLAYWKERMGPESAFLGQLSVDIGAWYMPHRDAGKRPRPPAWRSTKDKIAERVWDQIEQGLEPAEAKAIVTPNWHHLDTGIRFEVDGRFAFGSRAVLEATASSGPFGLTIGGSALSAASLTALAAAIQTSDPRIATLWSGGGRDRIVIGALGSASPGSDGSEARVLVVVRPPEQNKNYQGTTFHVRVNGGIVRSHAGGAADTPDTIRNALVSAINANEVGVTAVVEPGAGEFTVRSGNKLDVSVLALDPAAANLTQHLVVDPPEPYELKDLIKLRVFDGASPIDNATPFLINNPGAIAGGDSIWRTRPGIWRPWGGLPPDLRTDQLETYKVFYAPTKKRWLMAGNHPATSTRLCTMESANESARHAVIAILHTLMPEPLDKNDPEYNGQGHLHGTMPEIFDPEDFELDDLEPLKRVDAVLADQKVPHLFDLLDLEQRIEELPPDVKIEPPEAKDVQRVLKALGPTLAGAWSFTPLDEIEQTLRHALEALYGLEH